MVDYPSQPPVESIGRLVAAATGREKASVDVLAKDGWVVQGYIQSLLIGVPTAAEAQVLGDQSLSEIQALSALEDLTQPQALGVLDGIKAALLKKLLEKLQGWIVEWLTKGGLDDLIGRLKPVV